MDRAVAERHVPGTWMGAAELILVQINRLIVVCACDSDGTASVVVTEAGVEGLIVSVIGRGEIEVDRHELLAHQVSLGCAVGNLFVADFTAAKADARKDAAFLGLLGIGIPDKGRILGLLPRIGEHFRFNQRGQAMPGVDDIVDLNSISYSFFQGVIGFQSVLDGKYGTGSSRGAVHPGKWRKIQLDDRVRTHFLTAVGSTETELLLFDKGEYIVEPTARLILAESAIGMGIHP